MTGLPPSLQHGMFGAGAPSHLAACSRQPSRPQASNPKLECQGQRRKPGEASTEETPSGPLAV